MIQEYDDVIIKESGLSGVVVDILYARNGKRIITVECNDNENTLLNLNEDQLMMA